MTTVTIEIESRQVIGYLQSAPIRINRAMRAAMEDATTLIHRQMQTYPPQRTGSTYKRTNTLRASCFAHPSAVRAMRLLARSCHPATRRHTIDLCRMLTVRRLCIGGAGLTRRRKYSGVQRRRFSDTLTGGSVRSSDANTGQGEPCRNGLTFSTS